MAAGDYLSTTKNAPFVPVVIANQVLGALGSYLNLGRTVTKDSDLTTQEVGTTINVPRRGTVSSNSLAENGSVTVQAPTSDYVQVVLDHHQEVTIGELDYARSIQQGGSVLPGYVEDGVIALGEDIESALAGLWASASFNNDATSDAVQDVIDMRTGLVKNKVPRSLTKYAYVAPAFMGKLLKATAFLDPKLIPTSNALTEGAVGRVSGFDVFEGQLVVKSGSPGVSRNLFYTSRAMVLATRPQPIPDAALGVQGATVLDGNGIALRVLRSYNPNKLGVQITVDVVWGVAVLDSRHMGCLDSVYA